MLLEGHEKLNIISSSQKKSLSKNNAIFSSCELYRWSLSRTIDSSSRRTLLFIGLNPSKANSYSNDPTLKRLLNFCTLLDYKNLVVLNLFARIATSPKILRTCMNPIGKENDKFLSLNALTWSVNSLWDICLGWGSKGDFLNREFDVLRSLRIHFINRSIFCKGSFGPLVFGLTSNGKPRHPLYLPRSSELKPYDWQKKFSSS